MDTPLPTTDIATRAIEPDDLPALLAMNNAAVPNVSPLEADELAWLVRLAGVAEAVTVEGEVRGFVLALPPDTPYLSPNYLWFSRRYADFLYVDRIVVGEGRRSAGLGTALYDVVFDRARRADAPMVACEVNLEPPGMGLKPLQLLIERLKTSNESLVTVTWGFGEEDRLERHQVFGEKIILGKPALERRHG